MRHRLVATALLAALVAPAVSLGAQPPFPLASQTMTLPASTRTFPPGPGVDVAGGACVICHSPGMVLNQPPLSKAAWEAEVRKMITVYKAPIPEASVAPIVAYLAQIKGTN